MGLIPLGFWAASGGGGGAAADYELISTTVLGSAAASVTFSGLGTSAAAYKHLQIRMVSVNSADVNRIRFNGDAAANYSCHYLRGNGSTVTSAATTGSQHIQLSTINAPANSNYGAIIDILDFASTTKNKTVKTLMADSTSGIEMNSGAWYSTAAITSIEVSVFSGLANIGSRYSLYGLRG